MKRFDLVLNGQSVDHCYGEAIPGEKEIQWSFLFPQGASIQAVEAQAPYETALALCHKHRLGAYPSVGDQLDAAYKARQGDTTVLSQVDQVIANVKAQYPKPIAPSSSGAVYGFFSKQAAKAPMVAAARKPLAAWQVVLICAATSGVVFAVGVYLLRAYG